MKRISILLAGASLITLHAQDEAEMKSLDPDHAYNLAAEWILDPDPRHRAWAAELIAHERSTAIKRLCSVSLDKRK